MANQPPPSTTAIIGPQYCAPATRPIELIVIKERMGNNFTIRDINDNVIFIVKSSPETLFATREDRFLYDANGNPILHLRRMLQTADDSCWKAYRGESTEAKDYIFTRKRSSLFQLRTKLNVFLANNNTGDCDFVVVKADLFGESWKVLIGNSDNVVAQINKKPRALFSREKFMVTVCPNIDYAFIVALTVTLTSSSRNRPGSGTSGTSMSHGASSIF
ncbi:protein LURP-one-related [Trifolium repens]|nr:protein LURP-one-related [Trifolium repens]